jgi:hypothetical protein
MESLTGVVDAELIKTVQMQDHILQARKIEEGDEHSIVISTKL